MEIRDAVEADAERLAALTDAPTDFMRNLVHDRTVRVAAASPKGADDDADDPEADDATGDGAETEMETELESETDADADTDAETDDDHGEAVRGFVSFDARASTVHVTQLEGDPGTCVRLLEATRRFAAGEGMSVELLVPEGEDGTRTAAERAGFEDRGSGPRFGGTPTIRYRWEPDG